MYPPLNQAQPYEPLTGQFVLNFEVAELEKKIHAMASRSAEEWFELGMACDTNSESLDQAAEAYRKAVEAAPEWVEARINLGTTFYQLGRMGRSAGNNSKRPLRWSRKTLLPNSISVACISSLVRLEGGH